MKELLTTIIISLIVNVHALNVSAPNVRIIDHPKASLTLQFEQETGTNGSSVAFNLKAQLYYSVIAGNKSYPLEVFDVHGNNVYQTNAGVDMRGLWWNKKTKSLQGNSYNGSGIISFPMDDKSYPSIGAHTIFEDGDDQPGENSCGVYDSKKKQTLYYKDGMVYKYAKGKKVDSLKLSISKISNINSQSMIYTGVKSMEIGILDYVYKKVYLYNKKTGEKTATITLPSNAVIHDMFRFSYANNFVFLYDVDSRSWTGYQIFN